MKVGFFHVDPVRSFHLYAGDHPGRERLQLLIASVRRALPGVPIVHLTDRLTCGVRNVDETVRGEDLPIALGCIEAYARCDGDWLLLDTDTIVHDGHLVGQVFAQDFDIAVATREGTLRPKEVGTKFMAAMPFNKGVVYSKSAAFWRSAAERLRELPAKRQAWMGDQQAMNDVIAGGLFNVLRLPSVFNYPPLSQDEDLGGIVVAHYKGPRKSWMALPS